MSENKLIIPIQIAGRAVRLTIYGEGEEKTVFEVPDALQNAEAPYQIIEGRYYEYDISPKDFCLQSDGIISQSKVNISSGRISPNIYVGTLAIKILNSETQEECGEVNIEVQSIKTKYREDYRTMMEEITEKCNELLLQYNSPSSHSFEVDHNSDAQTLYQRFAFLKSILDTIEFNDAVHKIISSPVTKWKETETLKDIRNIKRINASALRQIGSTKNRLVLPEEHPLKNTLHSVPARLKVNFKTETVDTPENRFIKHALNTFQLFCNDFKNRAKGNTRLKNEAKVLEEKLEHYLSYSIFKEISSPAILALNSPVLQRKEGYREVLRIWLMADLAAKLVWHGGDEVYKGNKKDVATLYEYWLYFKLLDVIKEIFHIEPKAIKDLIKETPDGLGLQLMQGKHLPMVGVYDSGTRQFNVQFSYNRTFSGKSKFPASGSWTKDMRPDYTLTIWPAGIDQTEAEIQELIVHIHFDAKYKVDLNWIIADDTSEEQMQDDLSEEKKEYRQGNVKRVDLLKMHSYKDAIRRTGGAYVLYPGDINYSSSGFHEILPGLGAFSIRPGKENSGVEELKIFLLDVVRHFQNRTSQREKMSYQTYETHQGENTDELNEPLPETYGVNRGLLPDTTSVLVAFYKKENWDWILKTGLYNARTEANGALTLGPKETGAKYILLHSHGETISGKLFKVKDIGPKVFSKQSLIKKGYPGTPSQEFYLVYKVEPVSDKEFSNKEWNISKLEGYKPNRNSALPFSVTLTELMKAIIKS